MPLFLIFFSEDEGPSRCFNPANSYNSQWYTDGTVELQSSIDGSYFDDYLYGIADFDDGGSRRNVTIKITDGVDYYVGFNRNTGINEGTKEAANEVMVVTLDESLIYSNRVASLGEGGSYNTGNYTVSVVSINTSVTPGYAHVVIKNDSSPTSVPSASPSSSSSPSSSPSTSWKPSASFSPSATPSSFPSSSSIPSSIPSSPPSISDVPSQSPSNAKSAKKAKVAKRRMIENGKIE